MEAGLSFEDQLARVQQRHLEQKRRERADARAGIPARTLAWLALPPDWTLRLADRCSFPCIGASTVAQTFARLLDAQLCTHQRGDEDDHYLVSSSTRAELCQQLSESEGLEWLVQEMCQISTRLLKDGEAGLPPDVARWAALACQVQGLATEALTQKLDDEVGRLLQLQQSGQALRWIVTARQFEDLLGDELTYAIQRASRRLDLFHRRSEDLRALERFLPRPQQIDAFKALLRPNGRYMLHYIGDGGMGKTMLARYLNSVLADELQISTARIAFDYLNPDFPWRRPGLLLQELAVELRLQDEGDATKSVAMHFRRFDEKLAKEHERRSAWTAGERLLPQTSGVSEMLVPFANALKALPRQPVVLILDTCEELAKIRPDGTVPASVQATFALLRSLHRRVPTLRIVFCGRRSLAPVGARRRRGLQILEVGGFTHAEAVSYLSAKVALPEALREPVIERSLMPAEPNRIVRGKRTGQSHDLYNPFDLALYALWMQEAYSERPPGSEAALVEELRGVSGDRYVEMRIVRRNPALAPLLPTVSLLGRFEKETLHASLPHAPEHFDQLFQELAQQEWLDHQRSDFYEVRRGLRPRLLAYYQQAEPATIERTRGAILAHLEHITLEHTLSTLDISHFDIALRLGVREPERAARWWRAVEERIARTASYHWFRPVIEFLLSDDGAVAAVDLLQGPLQEHPLRLAVLATFCAVLMHTESRVSSGPYWLEIERNVERFPLVEERERLRLRVLAGILSSGIVATAYPQALIDRSEALWQVLDGLCVDEADEQLLASCSAAIESSTVLPSDCGPLLRLAQRLVGSLGVSEELQCFYWMVVGRTLARAGQLAEARVWFRRAMQGAPCAARQLWLDWQAPENLAARVGLTYIVACYPAALSAREMLAEIEQALPSGLAVLAPGVVTMPAVSTVDHDRLLAALLVLRGAIDEETSSLPQSLFAHLPVGPFYGATSDVHRAYPPLFAVLAGLMGERGLVSEAFDYLAACKREAERSASQREIVLAADEAALLLIRRMRLRDEGWDPGAGTPLHPLSHELDALDGLKVEPVLQRVVRRNLVRHGRVVGAEEREVRQLQELHQRWRCVYALDPQRSRRAQDWFGRELAAIAWRREWGASALACKLDELEMHLLARREESFEAGLAALSPADDLWMRQQLAESGEQSVQALTLGLRYWALSGTVGVSAALVERVGTRRAAAIVLDEGALLALRLPSNALLLLNRARTWFVKVHDGVQALIASLCLTLATVRLSPGEAHRALEQTLRDYQVCRKCLPDLPPVSRLRSIAEDPQQHALDALAPVAWRPWLVRLIACVICSAGRTQRRTGDRQPERSLLLWLQTHYGVGGEALHLPAELDGLFEHEQALLRAPFAAADRHSLEPIALWQLRTSPAAARQRMIGIDLLLRESTRRGPAFSAPSIEEPVAVALHMLDGREIVVRDIAAVDAYGQAASLVQRSGGEVILRSLNLHSNHIPVSPIVLQLAYETSGICWEGIIAQALRDRLPDWQALRFHRIFALQRPAVAGIPRVRSLLGLAGNSRQGHLLQKAWEPLLQQQWRTDIGVGESLATLLARAGERAVACLHLLASPVETAGGLRLESTGIYHQARETDLLQVEEIARKCADLQLCILQCPPQEGTERSSTERARIGNLRLLAGRLFALGVAQVLTIPALSWQQSERVLDHLARALSAEHWQAALDRAIIDARLFLLREIGDASIERAFDFCLYTSGDYLSDTGGADV